MIYYYHNLDLVVMITKIIQDVLETAEKKKRENNILLKTEDPKEKKS